ncbi:MAG: chorismate synthase [Nitrososphaerota archaeon]
MTGNMIGKRFIVISFGESHGKCIGVVIDGCPAGLPISEDEIQSFVDLRRPGQSLVTTQRKEEDKVEILSGIFDGHTTGAPIAMVVWNKDVDSRAYDIFRQIPRPSHADYFAFFKYGGYNDWRGGGRFSGRITVGFVMAGAVALKLIKYVLGIDVLAYTKSIGDINSRELTVEEIRKYRYLNEVRCPDLGAAKKMKDLLIKLKSEGDSIGGIIECIALNVPIGLGEPVFDSLDSEIAKAIFSIPAVKGIEFGKGFSASRMTGSQHNDPLTYINGRVIPKTNNAGGIVGGLSTGSEIIFRVAFKPPASISKPQKTLNIQTLRDEDLIITGRHDPSVVPRAVPIVESMTAIVLADHAIRAGLIAPVIKER